jgi:hypothetical protein
VEKAENAYELRKSGLTAEAALMTTGNGPGAAFL